MPIPTRDQAIGTLDEGHAALDALVTRLEPEEMTRAGTIGDTWSVKDLVGHLAFWEELAGEALRDWRAGRSPSVEQIFAAGSTGVDAANAANQEKTAGQSLEVVQARAAAAHAAVLEAIRPLSDDEWRAKAPYPTRRRPTLAELLGSILGAPKRPFGHALAHLSDLEAYVESLGRR